MTATEPTTTETERVIRELLDDPGCGLSVAAAARLIPGHRGRPGRDASTVIRWMRKGIVTPAGVRVSPGRTRVGRMLLTTKSAIARFMAAMSEPASEVVRAARTNKGWFTGDKAKGRGAADRELAEAIG